MNRLIGAIIAFIFVGLFHGIVSIFETVSDWLSAPARRRQAEKDAEEKAKRYEEKHNYYEEKRKREQEERNREEQDIIKKYQGYREEDIIVSDEIFRQHKLILLRKRFNYGLREAMELVDATERAKEKAKRKALNRKVNELTRKLYDDMPSDDKRVPISDDVKDAVWRRDGGKCIKCGSQERLEFDHVIPVSKGGSNTARNIQILCEKCNREKSDNIS